VFAAGWTGSIQLIGGPFPTWMIAIGTSAAILLIVPTLAVGLNWYMTATTFGSDWRSRSDFVYRFILFGALSYFVVSAVGILLACYKVSETTQFSLVPIAWFI